MTASAAVIRKLLGRATSLIDSLAAVGKMQDPYFAVKEEVEHSVSVVVDLHKRWQEFAASQRKGEDLEWTSSELLSGLRSIEWDLQDLEDTVSIVEGNRVKFHLDESDVQARRALPPAPVCCCVCFVLHVLSCRMRSLLTPRFFCGFSPVGP